MAKRAKRANIYYVETKGTYSKVEQIGIGINKNVTRFLCDSCKNEVIVNETIDLV